jgi:acetolactate decarboxylase
MRLVMMFAATMLLAGCASTGNPPDAGEPQAWDGQVQVYGALRAMFHEGKTGAMVSLDSLLPNADLYGVGALADLSGEVTVIGGRAYLAYPEGAEATRTESTLQADVAATLLVTSEVPSWQSVVTDRAIRFEELDDDTFGDLQWHVIDGRRLTGGGSSHQDHRAAAVKTQRDRATATLVGFYSENDQGVFTHMGSRAHLHCVVLSTGHVDHVDIPAGITVKFPVDRNKRPNKALGRLRS